MPQPNASTEVETRNLASFASLTFAGLLGGILTVTLANVPALSAMGFYGAAFGVVIAGYFFMFRGLRSAWKIFGFIATSVVAYAAAFFSTLSTPLHLRFLDFSQHGFAFISTDSFFTGGVVGAGVLFMGFYFFLSPQQEGRRFLAKAVPFSLLAGLLAVFAWKAGNSLGFRFSRDGGDSNWDFDFLHIIWQVGVACMFGFLLPRKAHPSGSDSALATNPSV